MTLSFNSGLFGIFVVALLAAAFAALLTGCPEGDRPGDLPDQFKPETISITPPPPDCVWARSGGTFDNKGVSGLSGPHSFEIDWEARLGEGVALSPVVDANGNIYTGVIGGDLVCLDAEGSEVFRFGGGQGESTVTDDSLRSQPALGDGQIWLATGGGIVCLDFDGREIWRMPSSFLPEGGAINVAISPIGGLVAAMADGSIYLLGRTGEAIASVRTKGMSPNPATFDEKGNIYIGSSDRNVYRVSSEGSLNWTFNGKAAFLAAPLIYSDRMFATCMDGNMYATDMRGRERWRVELVYDAVTREKEIRKENESFISGLYWPPILRHSEPNEDGGEGLFELVALFSDRPDKVTDAIYMGAWIDEKGERKMRKALAESFIAGEVFGSQPVMDAGGKIYFAIDNRVFAVQGKDVLASIQMMGEAKTSGAQLVVTGGKRLLVPMNDGRLICLREAEEAAADDLKDGASEIDDAAESDEGDEAAIEAAENEDAGGEPDTDIEPVERGGEPGGE